MKTVFKEKIESTNLWGKENIETVSDKTVIYTNFQTNGRGRLNRKWLSFESDNLYASILLKPEGDFLKLPIANLTQLLSVVIVDILRKHDIDAYIKWPNDVIVPNNKDDIFGKKICGILAEVVTSSSKIKGLVLGFGLNVNATNDELSQIDRPATSMFVETDKKYAVSDILEEVGKGFFERYDDFMNKGFESIKSDYMSKIKFIDREITINMPNKSIKGIAKDINSDGAILLENNKDLSVITIGEIQWI